MESGSRFQGITIRGKNECWYTFTLQWYAMNLILSAYRGDLGSRYFTGYKAVNNLVHELYDGPPMLANSVAATW